ncbi:MAG: hypothetical protein ACFB6R_05680 [Alphaproteobacteria bacterium]
MTQPLSRRPAARPAAGPASPHIVFDAFQNAALKRHDDDDIAAARTMLLEARRAGWQVSHVFHRPPDRCFNPDDPDWRPIEGFEPSPFEMSFVTLGRTAFASRPFTERFLALRSHRIFFMSLAPRENCLETLAMAERHGLPFDFVRFDPPNSVCPAVEVAYGQKLACLGEHLESQASVTNQSKGIRHVT